MRKKNGGRVHHNATPADDAGNTVARRQPQIQQKQGHLRLVQTERRPSRPISPERPAVVTVYDHAEATRGGERVVLTSTDDLWQLARKPERPADKRAARLYARAGLTDPDAKRLKRNLEPPFLVILDVDKATLSLEDAIARLDVMGVAAVAHSTWSHGKRSGTHSYRILVDQVASTWEAVEVVTRELFDMIGVPATRESWKSPCFFVPAVPAGDVDRKRAFRALRTDLERSTWRPRPHVPRLDAKARRLLGEEDGEGNASAVSAEDRALVLDALPHIDNADYHDWIRAGMALKSSGLSDARELWDDWASQDYPDFDLDEQERRWEGFSGPGENAPGGGVGIGTIFHMAQQAGWKRPRRRGERSTPQEDFNQLVSPHARKIEMRDGDLSGIVDQAEAALLKAGAPIYRRGTTLVRPVRLDCDSAADEEVRRKAGALVLDDVTQAWLLEAMAKAAEWERYDKRSMAKVEKDPKPVYVQTLLARRGEWRFPALRRQRAHDRPRRSGDPGARLRRRERAAARLPARCVPVCPGVADEGRSCRRS